MVADDSLARCIRCVKSDMTDKISDNTGGGWGGDAYPMEEPEATDNRQQLQRDFMMEPWAPPETYRWAMTGTHISVGDMEHDIHFMLMGHSNWDGPHAWGTVEVSHRWDNLWHVDGGNLSLGMIEKRIRRYAKDQGWGKTTITDKSGVPMEATKVSSFPGTPEGAFPDGDWHHDDLFGEYSGAPYYGLSDDHSNDEVPGGMPMVCSECAEPFPNYATWRAHIEHEHINPDRKSVV